MVFRLILHSRRSRVDQFTGSEATCGLTLLLKFNKSIVKMVNSPVRILYWDVRIRDSHYFSFLQGLQRIIYVLLKGSAVRRVDDSYCNHQLVVAELNI
jgi:hypothetical protein